MKNLKLIGMVVAVCMSISAQAQTLFDNYDFDTASLAHAQAAPMTEMNGMAALGNYRMIATASRSYRGEFQKKDIEGIKNQDLSVPGLQVFAQSTGNMIQVIQLNLAKKAQNQGPAVVVYKKEGTMNFAQFSYKNGVVSDAVFFFSECKLLPEQSLLCAKRFVVQDFSQVNVQQAAMNNTIVGYDLYLR